MDTDKKHNATAGLAPVIGRRGFLAGSLAAAALSGASAQAETGAASARPLFGACRSSIEDVTVMRDLGYDFWEWSVALAVNPDKDDGWWQTQRESLAKRPLPIRSCNGFLPGRFRLTGPNADHGPALDYAEIGLRRAEEAGISTVVFGSGGARNVPGDFTATKSSDQPDLEKGVRQFTDFCRELARRVADLKNVQVVIEPLRPNESNIINYVFQGLAICGEVASPRVAQLADIFHMMMGGDDPSAICAAGPLLRHVHVAEYGTRSYPGADPSLTPRLKPYFAALSRAGYSLGVSCECKWGDGKDFAAKAKTAIDTMKGLM